MEQEIRNVSSIVDKRRFFALDSFIRIVHGSLFAAMELGSD